ncbi:MAG: hypothetical protein RLZZ382_2148 [Bacteroidota bacterium]
MNLKTVDLITTVDLQLLYEQVFNYLMIGRNEVWLYLLNFTLAFSQIFQMTCEHFKKGNLSF